MKASEIWSNLCFYGRCLKVVCQEWWRKIFAVALVMLACGCLSVVRIPLCNEQVSDEGEVTNRVWTSFCDEVPGMRVYPTVKMRCRVTAEWLKPIPPDAKGKRLHQMRMFKHWGWIPLGVVWMTAPFDAAIDTVFLPYDLYVVKSKEGK